MKSLFSTVPPAPEDTGLPLFGRLPSYGDSDMVVLSVPWSATASFGTGTQYGPWLLSKASSQMDFFSLSGGGDIRSRGVFLTKPPSALEELNRHTQALAEPVIRLEEEAPGGFSEDLLNQINHSCTQMVKGVYEQARLFHQREGKRFGLVGGDHSVSEGVINYFCKAYQKNFGILHIDAHADLRKAYQGFKHSHASVMYNVIHQNPDLQALVQVGVRDYCEEEYRRIERHKNIHTFFDSTMKAALFEGQTWGKVVLSVLHPLPEKVYISLDVDGCQPYMFPHTGTPVPGGLSFEELDYLLSRLQKSGRKLVGFDVVEMAGPNKSASLPDGYFGSRLLYRLCQMLLEG